jgi:hypothetical protein
MLRGFEKWGWGYLQQAWRVRGLPHPRHMILCVADHFEPFCREIRRDGSITGGCTKEEAMQRVRGWIAAHQATVDGIRDDDGMPVRHTFFYPWDEYDPDVLDVIARYCAQGTGEVEVQLHHRSDSEAGLRMRLAACAETLVGQHGLLGRTGHAFGYAFVHGNWALCNSRPDGDWCGVARELAVLQATGCYMDCTFPSAPSATQPRSVNRIYYGRDPESGHCGHRPGVVVAVGGGAPEGGVLMLPGPLGFYRDRERSAWRVRLENGALTGLHAGCRARFACWQRLHLHVAGRPDWLFVKLHTHGLDPRSREGISGQQARAFWRGLGGWCREAGMQLHHASAREMFNLIKAAEAGADGAPGRWRDRVYAPPPFR